MDGALPIFVPLLTPSVCIVLMIWHKVTNCSIPFHDSGHSHKCVMRKDFLKTDYHTLGNFQGKFFFQFLWIGSQP